MLIGLIVGQEVLLLRGVIKYLVHIDMVDERLIKIHNNMYIFNHDCLINCIYLIIFIELYLFNYIYLVIIDLIIFI